jgi:hypothetical protein
MPNDIKTATAWRDLNSSDLADTTIFLVFGPGNQTTPIRIRESTNQNERLLRIYRGGLRTHRHAGKRPESSAAGTRG